MKRLGGQAGFSLLELVLVLAVIATMLAIASPTLRNWNRGQQMKHAVIEFMTATQSARTLAISTASVHRLNVDTQNGRFWVTRLVGETFVELGDDLHEMEPLPEHCRIELTKFTDNTGAYIDFYPTGRVQPARVRIYAEDGSSSSIECLTPAETFRVVDGGGVR